MANFSKLLSAINGFNHTVDFSLPANVLEIGSMQMDGSTSGHVVISASATTSTYSMIWPAAQAASAGYILTNDGTGQLSWAPASATGANTTLSNLTSPTAINQDLIPSGTRVLGSSSATWSALWVNEILSPGQIDFQLTTGKMFNNSGSTVANFNSLLLSDNTNFASIDWQNRELIDGGGVNSQLSWSTSGISFDQLTASTVPYLNASKVLTSSAVTPTQLSYLDATSSIQTQLNSKLSLSGGTMSGSINGGAFEALNFADPASAQSLATKNYVDTTTISSGLMTTQGDIIYENATPAPARLPIGSTGQILTVAGGLPVWAAPAIVPLTSGVSGILPVANGGTNSNVSLNNNRIMVSSGGAIVEASALTNGQLLIGSTGAAPVAATLTPGAGVSITNTAGGITIAATGSGGTVTSVALADGSATPIFSISGSPITGSGTLTQTLVTQAANSVFAGPVTGSAAQPGFRALVSADIPSLSAIYLPLAGGTMTGSIAMGGNQITGLPNPTANGEALRYDQLGAATAGAAIGIATLDASGKIPVSQLPSVVMEYQQAWDPSTNTPTLADGSGTNGFVYRVSVAHTGAISGLSDPSMTVFFVGDLVIYSGAIGEYQRAPSADGVTSVNGAVGAVTVNAISQLTGDVTASAASGSQSKATTVSAIQGTTVSGTTGTGNVVFSAAPTFTGTANFAAIIASSTIAATGAVSGSNLSAGGHASLDLQIANNLSDVASASAAFANISPLTTAGDIIYESAAPTPARLGIGSTGQVLTVVAGLPAWSSPATSGTVTSVAFADGSAVPIFSVSGSPVTSSGTLTNTLINQNANVIFAGPSSGSAAQPSFRAIVSADLSAGIIGTTQLAAASVTAAKLGTVTDGVTLDQSGAGSTIEIKAAGVSATQLGTGAFDQVTITGGAGVAAAVAQSPALKRTLVAGQSFTANTSYAVRWGITANGETAGRVYAADTTTSSFNLFYVIGMASSAAGVSAGGNISVTTMGAFALSSADTAFASGTDGAPVFLAASGAVTMTPPSSAGTAVTRIGMLMIRSATVTSNIIDVHPVPVLVN